MCFYFLQGLDLPEVLVEVEKRGSSFDELLTIPEQDDWIYSDGKSTSCIAFILAMYKEAGLFDPIASSIQVTEFTVSLSGKKGFIVLDCNIIVIFKFYSSHVIYITTLKLVYLGCTDFLFALSSHSSKKKIVLANFHMFHYCVV